MSSLILKPQLSRSLLANSDSLSLSLVYFLTDSQNSLKLSISLSIISSDLRKPCSLSYAYFSSFYIFSYFISSIIYTKNISLFFYEFNHRFFGHNFLLILLLFCCFGCFLGRCQLSPLRNKTNMQHLHLLLI